MSDTFQFTLFEKVLILAGLMFFINAINIASGGGFEFLYIAKGVYLIGIALLLYEFISTES